MLRRLKESVAAELPSKTERLVVCAMSPYQQALNTTVRWMRSVDFQVVKLLSNRVTWGGYTVEIKNKNFREVRKKDEYVYI